MLRFSIQIDVANGHDVAEARDGLLPAEKVRRMTISAVVDSGASRLVLPEAVVKKLGLVSTGKVRVRYADGRTAKRERVQYVHLEAFGRDSVFSATVEPHRRSALLGAIVLEELDFLVDCTHQRLVPRDKRYIVSEIE